MTGKTLPAKAKQGEARIVDGDELLEPPPARLKPFGGSRNDRFNNVLTNMLADTLWKPEWHSAETKHDRVNAALAAMLAFKPRDEVEGMMAAQAVALHHAAMECLRRAMHPEQPSEAAAKLRRDAANLTRSMVEMAEAIERRRGKAPQVVRVERVVVQDGGQAIVGAVATGASPALGGGSADGS